VDGGYLNTLIQNVQLLLKLLYKQRKLEFESEKLTLFLENNVDLEYMYSTGII
jgi:hypothetical protein